MRLDKKDLSSQILIGFKNSSHYTILWLLKVLPTGEYLTVQSKVGKLGEAGIYEGALDKSIQVLEEEYRKNLKKLGEKNGKKN